MGFPKVRDTYIQNPIQVFDVLSINYDVTTVSY